MADLDIIDSVNSFDISSDDEEEDSFLNAIKKENNNNSIVNTDNLYCKGKAEESFNYDDDFIDESIDNINNRSS